MTLFRKIPRKSLVLVGLAVLLVVLLLVPGFTPTFYTRLVTTILIWSIFAMSLDLLLGYTGLPSLGHAAYFGIAAYTVALLNMHWGIESFSLNLLVGLGIAVLTSLVFGLLILRTTHVTFLLITLALAQVLWGLAFRWSGFTGGDNGISGLQRPTVFGHSLASVDNYYYAVLVFFAVAALLMYLVTISPFGHSLVGIRESTSRMLALGYNVWLHKYIVVVIAGLFAGLAGILEAYQQQFVAPNVVEVQTSVKVLLIVMIGGAGTLIGPAIGAAGVLLLEDFVSRETERWLMVMGALYILLVLVAPRGIVGELRNMVESARRKKADVGRVEAQDRDLGEQLAAAEQRDAAAVAEKEQRDV
jgi:branched-chain amino acid transport system permease protein